MVASGSEPYPLLPRGLPAPRPHRAWLMPVWCVMASGCNGRVRWWPGDVCAPILRASTPSPLVRVWGGGGAGVGMRGSRPKLTTFFFSPPKRGSFCHHDRLLRLASVGGDEPSARLFLLADRVAGLSLSLSLSPLPPRSIAASFHAPSSLPSPALHCCSSLPLHCRPLLVCFS